MAGTAELVAALERVERLAETGQRHAAVASALRQAERHVEAQRAALVRDMRRRGRSWREVGEVLELSHAAAMKRYRGADVDQVLDDDAQREGLTYDQRIAAALIPPQRPPAGSDPVHVEAWKRSLGSLPSGLERLCPCGSQGPWADRQAWEDQHAGCGWHPRLLDQTIARLQRAGR